MLVLIDESGCAGFKPASSSHFIIGMIIFEKFEDAEDTAKAIHRLKADTGFKREFRFSSCNNKMRDSFFEVIKHANFKIRILVVEKERVHSPDLKKNDELFMNYCLKNLIKMKSDGAPLANASVKIDGKGSQAFKRACASYLRKELPRGTIKKLSFADSENDVLIQLADMVVSAFSRPYHNPNKSDAAKWRESFKDKIEGVWNFK